MYSVKTKVKFAVARLKVVVKTMSIWLLGVVFGVTVTFIALETPKLIEVEVLTFENTLPVMINEVEASSSPLSVEWIKAEASSYSKGDGYTPGTVMASGKKVYIGAIACPRSIALGTKIEIKDIGKFTCEDRMHKRYTNTFDIYNENIEEALAFGRKEINYRIINDLSK